MIKKNKVINLFLYYDGKCTSYKFSSYQLAVDYLFDQLNHDHEILVGKIYENGEDEPLMVVNNF